MSAPNTIAAAAAALWLTTSRYVQYVDQATAQSLGLINVTSSGSVYIGVDHTSTLSPSDQGRKSVRITSNVAFDHGLLVADIQHMPGSICGVWPAFWTTGNQWPQDGEIGRLLSAGPVDLGGTNPIAAQQTSSRASTSRPTTRWSSTPRASARSPTRSRLAP